MVKILGYTDREITRLYQLSTTMVVVVAILLSMVVVRFSFPYLIQLTLHDNPGWLGLHITPRVYVAMFGLALAMYLVVAALEFKKIKRIPMTEALKNVE